MLVKIEDTTYKVSWRHLTNEETKGRSTHCQIHKVVDVAVTPYELELVDEAIAFCHPNDIFVKAKGRKYSLKKALKYWINMVIPISGEGIVSYNNRIKAQRREFWKAYLTEFPACKQRS